MGKDSAESVRAMLAPMFTEARAKSLWFHCAYQNLWFSPDELAEMHNKGRFLWGPVNWTLRDPNEEARRLMASINEAAAEYQRFRDRIARRQEADDGTA